MREKGFIVVGLLASLFSGLRVVSQTPVLEAKPARVDARKSRSALPSADQLIKNVAARYGDISFYSARGVNRFRSTVNNLNNEDYDIQLQLEYRAKTETVITWESNGQKKVFRSNPTRSWLEVDGTFSEKYGGLGDGLLAVALSEPGRPLCLLDSILFHDETMPESRYFTGVVDLQVTGEADLGGNRCYLLRGSFKGSDGETVYWIDSTNSLIRRIDFTLIVETKFPFGSRVDTTKTSETYTHIVLESRKTQKSKKAARAAFSSF